MKKIIIMAAATAVLGAGVAYAQDGRRGQAREMTRAEATTRAQAQFAQMDLNKDGRLIATELEQAFEQRRAERQQRMQERLSQMTPEQRARMEARRAEWQAKGGGPGAAPRGGGNLAKMLGPNGVVTQAQFVEHALKRFDQMDANKDGVIKGSERPQRGNRGQRMNHDQHQQDGSDE